jgi:hypothetical protein
MIVAGTAGQIRSDQIRSDQIRSDQTWHGMAIPWINMSRTPIDVFDVIRKSVLSNRSQFYRDLTLPFFGYNRRGAAESEGVREHFWLQGMTGGIKGHYDCEHEFSEVNYTEDLNRISVPTLVVHGDDEQIVPIAAAGIRSAEIVPHATLKVYPGAPHGLPVTHQDQLNQDLLDFIRLSRCESNRRSISPKGISAGPPEVATRTARDRSRRDAPFFRLCTVRRRVRPALLRHQTVPAGQSSYACEVVGILPRGPLVENPVTADGFNLPSCAVDSR